MHPSYPSHSRRLFYVDPSSLLGEAEVSLQRLVFLGIDYLPFYMHILLLHLYNTGLLQNNFRLLMIPYYLYYIRMMESFI
jgi:hypothetical protein